MLAELQITLQVTYPSTVSLSLYLSFFEVNIFSCTRIEGYAQYNVWVGTIVKASVGSLTIIFQALMLVQNFISQILELNYSSR